jgi:tRNA(adenine34) deaminase
VLNIATGRDVEFMREAIRLARIALERGDTPVGSVVVCGDRVIGEGVEAVRSEKDLTAHAEIIAVREACRSLGSTNLACCSLFTTVEPCLMCSFIIRSAHVSRIVTGKAAPQVGGISSKYPILVDRGIPSWPPPPVVITGVLEEECGALFLR